MQSNENNKNRGTHGDSLRMLNELSLSNKNPPDLAVGSVNEYNGGKGTNGEFQF